MSVLMLGNLGVPLTERKITGSDTMQTLNEDIYKYRRWKLNVTDADSEVFVGEWLYGAAGGVAKVVEVSMSAWTNGVGYFIVDSWNGTDFVNAENVGAAGGAATDANVNGILVGLDTDYPYKGMTAKAALVTVYDATAGDGVIVGITGGYPDQTLKQGITLLGGDSLILQDIEAIRNLRFIDYTSGDAVHANVVCFF